MLTKYGGIRKENVSIFSLQFLLKSSPPHYLFIMKSLLWVPVIFIKQFLFVYIVLSCFHKPQVSIVNLVYFGITQFLLSCISGTQDYCPFIMFIMWQLNNPVVNNFFHHEATQNPGHGTKLVTLPSPVLLY